MKMEIEGSDTLSLERKIKMHEAREAIIDRLAMDLPTNIQLERFLQVVVSEIGRMMEADRCDLIQLTEDNELEISHEWRASEDIPTSQGTQIPIDTEKLAAHFDLTKPIIVNDTSEAKDSKVRFLAKALETRSLLVLPISINKKVIGLLGLHDTKRPRIWLDDEVSFLESIASQLAIGYQYTTLYVRQEQESRRTYALLEIANTLNSHSDFNTVSSSVLERAVSLLGADYGALGVLDQTQKRLSLAAFKMADGVKPNRVLEMIDDHNQSLDIEPFPALSEILAAGKTVRFVDSEMSIPTRLVFNSQFNGKATLVAPVRVGGQPFGLLGFVWGEMPSSNINEHEIAIADGISDQIGTALERDRLSAEIMRLKSELHERNTSRIIGQSPNIQRPIELALNVADTTTTVLVQGESGTGKELIANLIHYNSGRENHPYVKINCGAIPESLMESELFGHEKGAFTDAHTARKGRFEEADGGTLFLDEIGELPLSAQVKLLRVLQEGELMRIGGSETIKIDVRVIAASNVDLEEAVEEEKFRKDLFYRLSVFPIEVPPLRERPEDINLLVFHFLELYKEKSGRFVSGISKEAMRAMVNYEWFGNVRELENAIERAVIIASGRQIELDDLPSAISKKAFEIDAEAREERAIAASEGRSIGVDIEIPSTIGEVEKRIIEATLDYTNGDKSKAAKLMSIGRKTLYRKLNQYEGGDSE